MYLSQNFLPGIKENSIISIKAQHTEELRREAAMKVFPIQIKRADLDARLTGMKALFCDSWFVRLRGKWYPR